MYTHHSSSFIIAHTPTHSVVFAAFSPEKLKERIIGKYKYVIGHTLTFHAYISTNNINTYFKDNVKVLITADEAPIGDKVIPLKQKVDEALKNGTTSIEHVLVAQRTGRNVPMSDRDIALKEVRQGAIYTYLFCA